jgi:RimJ/RimL family protein N-acetyltransferase
VANGLPPLPEATALLLHTERLDLVPILREHAPDMFEVLRDPILYRYTGGEPPIDVAALARLYEFWEARVSPDESELWLNWIVKLRETGASVGHVQAGITSDHADLAWVVGTRWQRRGYATEAAQALVDWLLRLGVRDLRASIHPDHAASIRVAEHLGLKRTTERNDIQHIWKRAGEGPPHP